MPKLRVFPGIRIIPRSLRNSSSILSYSFPSASVTFIFAQSILSVLPSFSIFILIIQNVFPSLASFLKLFVSTSVYPSSTLTFSSDLLFCTSSTVKFQPDTEAVSASNVFDSSDFASSVAVSDVSASALSAIVSSDSASSVSAASVLSAVLSSADVSAFVPTSFSAAFPQPASIDIEIKPAMKSNFLLFRIIFLLLQFIFFFIYRYL